MTSTDAARRGEVRHQLERRRAPGREPPVEQRDLALLEADVDVRGVGVDEVHGCAPNRAANAAGTSCTARTAAVTSSGTRSGKRSQPRTISIGSGFSVASVTARIVTGLSNATRSTSGQSAACCESRIASCIETSAAISRSFSDHDTMSFQPRIGRAEVAHDEHGLAVLLPPVDDRVTDPGGQRVEHAVTPQHELAADGVTGEPHRQVALGPHPLHHEPAAVTEADPFDRRAGPPVVPADRHPFDGFVEDRGHRAALPRGVLPVVAEPDGVSLRRSTIRIHDRPRRLVPAHERPHAPLASRSTLIVAGSSTNRSPARGPSSSATDGEHPQEVAVREQQHRPRRAADPLEDPLGPGADRLGRSPLPAPCRGRSSSPGRGSWISSVVSPSYSP